jgi:hypothetical protein
LRIILQIQLPSASLNGIGAGSISAVGSFVLFLKGNIMKQSKALFLLVSIFMGTHAIAGTLNCTVAGRSYDSKIKVSITSDALETQKIGGKAKVTISESRFPNLNVKNLESVYRKEIPGEVSFFLYDLKGANLEINVTPGTIKDYRAVLMREALDESTTQSFHCVLD